MTNHIDVGKELVVWSNHKSHSMNNLEEKTNTALDGNQSCDHLQRLIHFNEPHRLNANDLEKKRNIL